YSFHIEEILPKTAATDTAQALRHLPSVDALLGDMREVVDEIGQSRATDLARSVIAELRSEIISSPKDATRDELMKMAVGRFQAIHGREVLLSVTRVINGTGVVLHTNLGRAPMSEEARTALEK